MIVRNHELDIILSTVPYIVLKATESYILYSMLLERLSHLDNISNVFFFKYVSIKPATKGLVGLVNRCFNFQFQVHDSSVKSCGYQTFLPSLGV